jgi:hypothetical protein
MRDTTLGGGGTRNYISGCEGSQAVPACPSDIGNAYYRNFVLYIYNIYDTGGAALVKLGLTLGGLNYGEILMLTLGGQQTGLLVKLLTARSVFKITPRQECVFICPLTSNRYMRTT